MHPFLHLTKDEILSWCTSTVVALVRSYHERRDVSVLPILADALQDAGCPDRLGLDDADPDAVGRTILSCHGLNFPEWAELTAIGCRLEAQPNRLTVAEEVTVLTDSGPDYYVVSAGAMLREGGMLITEGKPGDRVDLLNAHPASGKKLRPLYGLRLLKFVNPDYPDVVLVKDQQSGKDPLAKEREYRSRVLEKYSYCGHPISFTGVTPAVSVLCSDLVNRSSWVREMPPWYAIAARCRPHWNGRGYTVYRESRPHASGAVPLAANVPDAIFDYLDGGAGDRMSEHPTEQEARDAVDQAVNRWRFAAA